MRPKSCSFWIHILHIIHNTFSSLSKGLVTLLFGLDMHQGTLLLLDLHGPRNKLLYKPCKADFRGPLLKKGPPGSLHIPYFSFYSINSEKMDENTSPAGLGHLLTACSNMGAPINFCKISFLIQATFLLPSLFGGSKKIPPPKIKKGDYFSIVIWTFGSR